MKIGIYDKRGIPVGCFYALGTDGLSPRLVLPNEEYICDRWETLQELDVELEVFRQTGVRGCRWGDIFAANLPELRRVLLEKIQYELLSKKGLSVFRFRSVVDSPDGEPERTFSVTMDIVAPDKGSASVIRDNLLSGQYRDNILILQ